MKKLCSVLFVLLAVQFAAFAADPALLNLVMPDAKVVVGVSVDAGKGSPFGKYILGHMQPDDEGFKTFLVDTSFDPRRDLNEIVMASNWNESSAGRWLVLARGVFDPARISSALLANGGTSSTFQGIDLLSGSGLKHNGDSVVAFLDNTSAVMGDADSVKAAIQRRQSKAVAAADLITKVNGLSPKNDFWFVTLVPLSEFSYVMPDPNLSSAMKGNLLQAVTQASGGIKFSDPIRISAEAVARSDKDASALADVVRFIAGLVQSNREQNKAAGEVATLLDKIELNTTGNVMTMSLAVPESTIEHILDSAKSERKKTAAARRAHTSPQQ